MTEDELILTAILKCRRVDLYAQKINLTSEQQKFFDEVKARRKNGEPIQYILGETEFCGHRFKLNTHVLIPRPETEQLVEIAVGKIKDLKRDFVSILDLGTGSGNIAVSLASAVRSSYVVGIDISSEALTVARRNAIDNNVNQKIDFINVDMSSYLQKLVEFKKQFDVIISNPPYIPSLKLSDLQIEVQKEPLLALDGGGDGLDFYRKIIQSSDKILKPGGFLFLEIGDHQSSAILDLFRGKNFSKVEIVQDLGKTDRFCIARA